ncbi:MAG TPA: group I intron-associated PD-(D/E)XK endonuclease [Terriglobales bacterium]|nr:group I intron-associated PD-(D/E)XK endonuclease [Terriglobales bacterium]
MSKKGNSTKYQVPSTKPRQNPTSAEREIPTHPKLRGERAEEEYQVPGTKHQGKASPSSREIPSHPKLRGEWAELQFMARAAAQGFRIAKPISDCYRWDLIVEHELGFHRVQVKSTTVKENGSYRCVYFSSAKYHDYSPEDFDFLAAYVVPEDVWYIIPSKEIETSSVTLDVAGRHPGNKYAKYKEAWHLLKRPGRFDIQACADVEYQVPSTQYQAESVAHSP